MTWKNLRRPLNGRYSLRPRTLAGTLALLIAILLETGIGMGQQTSTGTAPIFSTNAKYVNGVAPGYWPTAGAGLTLNLAAGSAYCGNPPALVTYAAGTLTMVNAATNLVYLDPANTCLPSVNQAANFAVGQIPIAKVVTAGNVITTITDMRGAGFAPLPCAMSSAGSVGCSALGTNQNITLTPPGTGSVLVPRLNNIRFADQFSNGSVTCGIQEAINDLPSSGGLVLLPNTNTTPCTISSGLPIVISKPVILSGHGAGGLNDTSTFDTYLSGTVITNGTTSSDVFQVTVPASNFVEGVVFKDFHIIGNKSVPSATGGNDITLVGGASTTNIRNVTLDRMLLSDAKGCNLKITDNAYMVNIDNSRFYRAASHGICIANASSGIPGQIDGIGVRSDLNGGDALNVNGSNVSTMNFFGSTFADSTNGVNIVVGSPTAQFNCNGCNFEKNSNAGVLISDGYGHYISNSTFIGDGVQLYGIYVNPPAAANFVSNQITLAGNNFSSNVTKDILFTANLHVGIVYTQALNLAAYTYQDNSGNAILLDASAGTLTLRGVLSSAVVTGTAPLLVASTTPVANLSLGGGSGTSVKSNQISSAVNTVTFSATPTFDASLGNTQTITNTGNVTSSTLSNATAGEWVALNICQDATGGRKMVYPATVLRFQTPPAAASGCGSQLGWFDGTNLNAVAQANPVDARLTAQTTAVGSTVITVPDVASHWLVTIHLHVTTSDASGQSVTGTLGWTEDGIALSKSTSAIAVASTGNFDGLSVPIYADAGSNITFSTSVSGAFTTAQYAINVTAQRR